MNKIGHVDLGILEKAPKWKLASHLFPSKIGGKPAWLSLQPLPSVDDLKCKICSDICIFLLQIYSPLVDDSNSFHRTIFVFICRNPDCSLSNDSRNIVVLRSCLPRKNTFFSFDPPDYDSYDPSKEISLAENYQNLCSLCGCFGSKKCSACKNVYYCSKSHQVLDWKERHKQECNKNGNDKFKDLPSKHLFEEFLLDINNDSEDESSDDDSDYDAVDDNKKTEKLEEMQDVKTHFKSKYSVEELEKMASSKTDEYFHKFKKTVEKCPEQVVRYSRGGEPLWITEEDKLEINKVPNCQYCESPRIFEFQIMPHLVQKLGLDSLEKSLDWGVIAIYTCKKSCTVNNLYSYRNEFAYKQDVTN